jgi:pimeloyl-ACP methyl ester carboxylesterase
VLLVSGSRDQMTPPRAARTLAGALKNVRYVTIEGCGHALMAEQPDRVLDSLRGFIMDG